MAISSLLSSLLPALFLAFVALSCYVVVGQGPPPDEDAVRGGGNGSGRTFEVDFAGQRFLKDGRPYRYIAGEIHYFRIHSSLWADRLHRVRAAGLNAVQVYIPWNYHEVEPGRFDFAGEKNISRFFALAQAAELDVLVRFGPYVCAEWEMGGLPWWLLREEGIRLRTADPRYLRHVQRFFDALLPVLRPQLHANGGPVIMLQIENEYGSMGICDKPYLRWLRDETRRQLGYDVVLYTTDGNSEGMLSCGSVEGVLTTVDFGQQGSALQVQRNFQLQDKHSGNGPHVNSEFYTMWFSGWGDKCPQAQNPAGIVRNLQWIWAANASVSMYMIHGGTNFGFWNGAELNGPVITSYDYAAPISEEGQITPLYLAIRDWVKTLPNWSHPPLDVPANRTGVALEGVEAEPVGDLLRFANRTIDVSTDCVTTPTGGPLSLEALPSFYNFALYSHTVGQTGSLLAIPKLRDYAFVYVDGQYQGQLTQCDGGPSCLQQLRLGAGDDGGGGLQSGQRLDIVVESYGRLTYPIRADPEPFKKGILGPVTIDKKPLTGAWRQCGIDFERVFASAKRQLKVLRQRRKGDLGSSVSGDVASPEPKPVFAPSLTAAGDGTKGPGPGPMVYATRFESPQGVDWPTLHTFFDSSTGGWSRGVLLVNGFNVGRYWSERGPQMTLYVPGAVFADVTTAIVIELKGRRSSTRMANIGNGQNLAQTGGNGSQNEERAPIAFVRDPIYTHNCSTGEEEEQQEQVLVESGEATADRKMHLHSRSEEQQQQLQGNDE